MVAIADSRDGIAVYRVSEKVTTVAGKASSSFGKAKIRLVSVTPFGEGLNPIAFTTLLVADKERP